MVSCAAPACGGDFGHVGSGVNLDFLLDSLFFSLSFVFHSLALV